MGNLDQTVVDARALADAAGIIRAVNHKLRQSIIALLKKEGKMTVTQLYVKLRLEQSVTSQHLAILRKSNVLSTQREGKFIYYSLNNERIEKLNKCIDALIAS